MQILSREGSTTAYCDREWDTSVRAYLSFYNNIDLYFIITTIQIFNIYSTLLYVNKI